MEATTTWFEVFVTWEEGDTETIETFDTEADAILYIQDSDYQNLSYDQWGQTKEGTIFRIK